MTTDQYEKIRALFRRVGTQYNIPEQALEDSIQEACKLYLEHEAEGSDLPQRDMLRQAAYPYSHLDREPYQLIPEGLAASPPTDLWAYHDLRSALADSIQEAATALGKDDGTGVLAFLLGSRDRAEVGNLMDYTVANRAKGALRRKVRIDLATFRIFCRKLGLYRGPTFPREAIRQKNTPKPRFKP